MTVNYLGQAMMILYRMSRSNLGVFRLVKRGLYQLNETLTVIANEEVSKIEGLTREIRVTYIPHVSSISYSREFAAREND